MAPKPTASTKVAPAKPAGKAAAGAKAAAPTKLSKTQWKKSVNHIFKLKERKTIHKVKDMSHFVKWPLYVRLQRQRAILKSRIKVPNAIAQFNNTITKDQAATLFRLLAAHRPESRVAKTNRLKKLAADKAAGTKATQSDSTKPRFIKQGLNHVTHLIETRKAKLVVIAHDVDPIELVVWLPTLCRKFDVPYCIVKGKARLGFLVHKKTTSCVAVTDIKKDYVGKLDQLATTFKAQYATRR